MKKLLLLILVAGGSFYVAYNFGFILGRSAKSGPPDFTRAETSAEYFLKAAMSDDEQKMRRISVDENEETLLQAAANLRRTVPPEKRGAAFRWQNTLAEQNEDQAYTGKIGQTIFVIGLRRVGNEYQVTRLTVG